MASGMTSLPVSRLQQGGALRAVPPGGTCTFPTASERQGTESREFEEGELVCLQNEAGTGKELAVYLRTEGNQHNVKTGDADNLSVIWWRVGRYSSQSYSTSFMNSFYSTLGLSNQAPTGTGAAGQGMGSGTQSEPYLFPSRPSPAGKGRSRRLRSKPRTTRRKQAMRLYRQILNPVR